jgi:hypothetical protein
MFGLLVLGGRSVKAEGEKKPPGVGPAVLEDLLRLTATYALASPSAERCENQK